MTKMFPQKVLNVPKNNFSGKYHGINDYSAEESCIMKSDWWVITEDAFLPLASRAKTRRGQICYASNITRYWQNRSSNRNIPLKKFPRWLKCVCMCDKWLRHIQLCMTLWTVACQAPLSMRFSRQECWSGLPWPSQGIFPIQGLNLCLLHFLHCYTSATQEAPKMCI